MEEVLETVEVGRPRREPEGPQFLDPEQADALIEQAREQGVELLGEGGPLGQMTKTVLERALAEELTDDLGYGVGDPAANGTGNSRNGYTPKRLLTEGGDGRPGGPPGPGRRLRPQGRRQGSAAPGRHRQDRDRPLRQRHDGARHPVPPGRHL